MPDERRRITFRSNGTSHQHFAAHVQRMPTAQRTPSQRAKSEHRNGANITVREANWRLKNDAGSVAATQIRGLEAKGDASITCRFKLTAEAKSRIGIERSTQTVFVRRHQNEMNMIGHQAVCPHRRACRPATLGKKRFVEGVVVFAKKDLLAPVAPLRHLMRHASRNDSRQPCHAATLARSVTNVN
ncbi:MAG: hypothetical protein WCA81_04870 [Rhizomicrobium sp.]